MATLLLRLAGPMQSWGTQSRFGNRDTGREPSKSGVIGLLCAARGTSREDDIALQPLAALRLGVRVDREGRLARDYQTAGGGQWPGPDGYGVRSADGKNRSTVESERYYLADAEFVVGLEGDRGLLTCCQEALLSPRWPLYLGRKAFVPSLPLVLPDGLLDLPLVEALCAVPWRPTAAQALPQAPLRLVLEHDQPTTLSRYDQPLSFRHEARQFGQAHRLRYLRLEALPVENVPIGGDPLCSTCPA